MSEVEKLVSWEGSVGSVDTDGFSKSLPEDITMDTVAAVDKARNTYVAAVAEEVSTRSISVFSDDKDADPVTVTGVGLGGTTTAAVTSTALGDMLIEVTVTDSEMLDAVVKRNKELF